MIDLTRESIVLYHGSNVSFEQVSLIHSKDKRDFGKGFYTTTYRGQADAWARNLYLRYGGDRYLYTFEIRLSNELKILQFEGISGEWLNMIKNNRIFGGIQHDYDIVIGPVADDNTTRTIALFTSGIYTVAMAMEQLRFFKANDQVSFHTGKAIQCLKVINKEILGE